MDVEYDLAETDLRAFQRYHAKHLPPVPQRSHLS